MFPYRSCAAVVFKALWSTNEQIEQEGGCGLQVWVCRPLWLTCKEGAGIEGVPPLDVAVITRWIWGLRSQEGGGWGFKRGVSVFWTCWT